MPRLAAHRRTEKEGAIDGVAAAALCGSMSRFKHNIPLDFVKETKQCEDLPAHLVPANRWMNEVGAHPYVYTFCHKFYSISYKRHNTVFCYISL